MRTNNDKVKNVIIGVYFIMIVMAILSSVLFSAFSDLTNNPFILFLIIASTFIALFFAVHKIAKFFEYDSDGINIIITNKGLLLSDYFNYREHTIEFEKDRLSGYQINNFLIYRELIVFIKDKKSEHVKKERFNITLLARKKRKYIKQSLRKTVKLNKKSNS